MRSRLQDEEISMRRTLRSAQSVTAVHSCVVYTPAKTLAEEREPSCTRIRMHWCDLRAQGFGDCGGKVFRMFSNDYQGRFVHKSYQCEAHEGREA